jgi:hypothetical protein
MARHSRSGYTRLSFSTIAKHGVLQERGRHEGVVALCGVLRDPLQRGTTKKASQIRTSRNAMSGSVVLR